MKRAASLSSSPAKSRAENRRRGGRGRQQQQAGKLRKLGLAVQEFVAAARPGSAPPDAPLQPARRGRRSRRELKREKRRVKRLHRRRGLLSGQEEAEGAAAGGERPEKKKKKKKPPPQPPPPKPEKRLPAGGEARLPRASGAPAAASASARKRALLAANEAEEREIRRLERQLGLSKRRKKGPEAAAAAVPPSFARDGLGYVLGALGSGPAFSGLYESSEGEDDDGQEAAAAAALGPEMWLNPTWADEGEEVEVESSDSAMGELTDSSEVREEAEEAEHESRGSRSPKAGAKEAGPREEEQQQQVESHYQDATKYIPPQLQRLEETVDAKKGEELERLTKSLKGLINRLSEPNLASISGQLEELYMANSRKDMNETLTKILTSACVMASAVPPRLVMEHVLLLSILHHRVGTEVGAHFLESVVRKFDDVYRCKTEGKECENLLTLIAHLYNFHVVHPLLIFDILKKLVSTFSEKDIELILLLLKNVGFSLRKDDALALKELIAEAQKKANDIGKQVQDQSRVCFMLEIMLALKNNDMRKIPGYDPEPVEKLRKLQRTLIHSSSSGKDAQLRVSLESLLSVDQVGRWWVVGSSWSGAPMIDSSTSSKTEQMLPIGKVSSKILELARKQRMNTDIRRNIFCILMTSEDFLDAFEKLLLLRLKGHQERDIVHVLIGCCLQEKTYNPFYAYLAAKFCEYDRRFQVTFQFSMWDKIRDLENLSTTTFSNLVNLLAHLLKTKSVSLGVFKVIEFSELDKPKVHFLRQVLTLLFLKTDPEELSHIFGKLADNPKLRVLHESLKLFLTHFLLKNIQAHKSIEEATLLKKRIELVNEALKAKESRLKL